jgi:hypothetical protein
MSNAKASDHAHHSCEKNKQKTKYDETGETATNDAKSKLNLLSRTNEKTDTNKERKKDNDLSKRTNNIFMK